MDNSKQTCAKELHRGKGPAILMRHNLMNCNVAIHCTLVARIVVMVACIEPWFIHVPRLYTLGGAGMPGQRLPTRKIGDVLRLRAGGMSKLQIAASVDRPDGCWRLHAAGAMRRPELATARRRER